MRAIRRETVATVAIVAMAAVIALTLVSCGAKKQDEESEATTMPPVPEASSTPAPTHLTGDLTWTVDPGVGIGPLKKDGGESDLVKAYGASEVTTTQVTHADHSTATASVIFASDPMRRVTIEWTDGSGRRIPARVTLEGDSSTWTLPGGITLGTPLDELERMNGKPFELSGFAWDGAGGVSSWRDGHLANLLRQGVTLSLEPRPGDRNSEVYQSLVGDSTFSSDQGAMRSVHPRVYRIVVYYQ
jgi:hypothetical protein